MPLIATRASQRCISLTPMAAGLLQVDQVGVLDKPFIDRITSPASSQALAHLRIGSQRACSKPVKMDRFGKLLLYVSTQFPIRPTTTHCTHRRRKPILGCFGVVPSSLVRSTTMFPNFKHHLVAPKGKRARGIHVLSYDA